MIEILREKLQHYPNKAQQYNYLREYLQLLILKILDEKGYFRNITFAGGTALRILYNLNRFSEDLDFSLIKKHNFSFTKMINTVVQEFNKQNFSVKASIKDNKTVASAFIKFDHLLFQLNLSPLKDQRLSVKLEIDQRPPKGFHTEFTMLNKEFLIGIQHNDLPSLFAGKLHAILCRNYTKGRDYYDLLWFLSRKTEPNYQLLANAIEQTEQKKLSLNHSILNNLLIERIEATDFKKVRTDIEPFLADHNELRHFEKEYFLGMIK